MFVVAQLQLAHMANWAVINAKATVDRDIRVLERKARRTFSGQAAKGSVLAEMTAARGEGVLDPCANCGYDLDNTAPGVVTSLGSGSHTAGVASPDPTVYMLWNRAPDNLSGIAGYGLFIASGSPGIPSAVMDIGDVTTYTTEALSPGTYYF